MKIPYINSDTIEKSTNFKELIKTIRVAFKDNTMLIPMCNHYDLPSIQGTYICLDIINGRIKAILESKNITAYITGMHTFVIEPNDPMKDGFILR